MAELWISLLLAVGLQEEARPAQADPAPEQDEAPAEEPLEPEPESQGPQGPPTFDHPFSLEEIHSGLAQLATAYPELASLESLGRSRQGNELQFVALTRSGPEAPGAKPALLFVDHAATPGRGLGGAEAVLAFGFELAARASEDPELAALLTEYVVYLMPACDPDLVAADAAPAAIEFDLNFPLGWQPDSLRAGSGAFPLARPETMGLARFLRSHPNLVLIVGAGASGPERQELWRGAEFPSSDREALDALCAPFSARTDVVLRPWGRLGSAGGGLFDYAYQALGIFPVSWVGVEPSEADADRVQAIAAGTLELLRSMPRMQIEPAALREVAPGLWEVDVRISNPGALPTLSAIAAERRLVDEIQLQVAGARLVATASKHEQQATFEVARLHGPGASVDLVGSTLAGGETCWLRLILEGQAGTRVVLSGLGARAGGMRLEVELR